MVSSSIGRTKSLLDTIANLLLAPTCSTRRKTVTPTSSCLPAVPVTSENPPLPTVSIRTSLTARWAPPPVSPRMLALILRFVAPMIFALSALFPDFAFAAGRRSYAVFAASFLSPLLGFSRLLAISLALARMMILRTRLHCPTAGILCVFKVLFLTDTVSRYLASPSQQTVSQLR